MEGLRSRFTLYQATYPAIGFSPRNHRRDTAARDEPLIWGEQYHSIPTDLADTALIFAIPGRFASGMARR